jgi:amino-acid N-acetyltransferase
MAQTQPVSTSVTIRQARHADLPELRQLIQHFVDTGHLLPRTLDELQGLLDSFFVAEIDGVLVGCAALEIYSKKLAEIRSLGVSAQARGQGVGKRLVQACVERAHEAGIYEVMAISAEDGFFQACGFDYTLPNLRRAFFLQTRDEL